MTMDFDPPRRERPAGGVRWMLLGIPIGVLGYYVASWSPILEIVFMIVLGLLLVLLYRRGARARVIRSGRTPLLVTGAAVVVIAILGGTAIGYLQFVTYSGPLDAVVLGGLFSIRSTEALLGAALGVAAGVLSLIYFLRRFSKPQPVG